MSSLNTHREVPEANGWALFPLLVFCLFYFGFSLAIGDFYKIPMPLAFLVAAVFAIGLNKKLSITEKVEHFATGMGKTDIMIMCLIFILAGAFTATAQAIGGVDATVRIAQHFIPSYLMTSGIFVISSLISVSIGTSCGTIAAITPISVGLAMNLGIDPGTMVGVTVGGAMFGDNLSLISDTTIAATRTQHVEMRDKMICNIKIVAIPALLCVVFYMLPMFAPSGTNTNEVAITATMIIKALPYVLLLVLGVMGVNVMLLLAAGVVCNCVIGLCYGTFNLVDAFSQIGKGTLGMAETLIVALLAGGLLQMIRLNGGITYIIEKTQRFINSTRRCEIGICGIVGMVNIFTANNTVAIITAGPIARELTEKYGVDPRRTASLLDTMSCCVQGLIPYGAQILIALGLAGAAKLTYVSLLPGLLYPALMGLSLLVSVLFTKNK